MHSTTVYPARFTDLATTHWQQISSVSVTITFVADQNPHSQTGQHSGLRAHVIRRVVTTCMGFSLFRSHNFDTIELLMLMFV
jgi:hypothetical protein